MNVNTDPPLERIEGERIVAYWLVCSSVVALVRLAVRSPEILAHLSAWRAAFGPFMIATLSLFAAWQLLRRGRGIGLAACVLATELFTLSAGPLAYRLDVGPFVRVGVGASGFIAAAGSDAHLLLVLGAGNRVPPGVALNVACLAALVILLASRSAKMHEHPG